MSSLSLASLGKIRKGVRKNDILPVFGVSSMERLPELLFLSDVECGLQFNQNNDVNAERSGA